MKPKSRLRLPALLARLPRVPFRPGEDWPVVPADSAGFDALGDDLALWRSTLEGRFREVDHEALRLQNRFWLLQLLFIAGSATASILGAIQAAVGGGNVALATAGAILSGLLAGLTMLVRDRRAQSGYLDARLRAERIKSEYFLFLARADDYGSAANPRTLLDQRVAEIEQPEASP
jgi:Protein of unknown function (DUF4231)